MVTIKLLVEGGKMTPGPAVAQQLGPMGLNLGQIISDVNEKTAGFKGMNVPVVLDIDSDTKAVTITVLSPPTSELLKKEIGVDKGSAARLKNRIGNLAFEQVISVALQKHDNMLSNEFVSSVKSVLGTCLTMGVLVDNHEIKEVMKDFDEGVYDAMIKAEKTEVDPEKAAELKDYFTKIDEAQVAEKAAEEEAASAAETTKEDTNGEATEDTNGASDGASAGSGAEAKK
jgi:large subunit ribosomal protein L11